MRSSRGAKESGPKADKPFDNAFILEPLAISLPGGLLQLQAKKDDDTATFEEVW